MGIKQKFAMLAGIMGVLLAIVSILGYYTAYSNLEESMEREISSTVGTQGAELEGWLMEKAKPVTSEADLMTELSDKKLSTEDMRRMLSLAASDKDVQEQKSNARSAISNLHNRFSWYAMQIYCANCTCSSCLTHFLYIPIGYCPTCLDPLVNMFITSIP